MEDVEEDLQDESKEDEDIYTKRVHGGHGDDFDEADHLDGDEWNWVIDYCLINSCYNSVNGMHFFVCYKAMEFIPCKSLQ